MIALYINDIKADLRDGTNISLSRSFERNGNSDYSYSFEMPVTPNNQKIFGYANKLESSNKQFLNYKARLEIDGSFAFDGYIRIDTANEDGYSVNLVGGQSNKLDDLFGDDDVINKIRMDDEYSVTFPNPLNPYKYDELNIKDASSSYCLNRVGANKAWFYPFALYSHPYNLRNTNFFGLYRKEQASTYTENKDICIMSNAEQVLLPMFNVPLLIKSIFKSKGYSVDGNFFSNKSIFKDLCESFSGDYEDYTERHNQRFGARIYIDDEERDNSVNSRGTRKPTAPDRAGGRNFNRQYENKTFDFCTLTEGSGGNAIKYVYSKVYSHLVGYREKQYDKTRYEEYYTPRIKDSFDRMITIDSDGSYKIRIPKSGWYKVNMQGKIKNEFRVIKFVDGTVKVLDYCSFDRNFFELVIVKNNSVRPYSGIYTNDSTCLGVGYVPTFEDGTITTGSSHFVDGSGKAMPFSLNDVYNGNDVSYNLMRTSSEKNTNDVIDNFIGDRSYLSQFSIPKNEGTLFVKNDDFVCGVRCGNQFYNQDDGADVNINRTNAGCLMNLPVLPTSDNVGENKAIRYGVGGQGVKQSVYKYNGTFSKNSDITTKSHSLRNNSGELMSSNFESDCHIGNTMLNLCNSKGYSQNAIYQPLTITTQKPSSLSDLESNPLVISSNDVDFGGSYYKEDLPNSMSISRAEYDNNNMRDEFSFDTNNVVWLDKDDELDVYLIAPAVIDADAEDIDSEDAVYHPEVKVKLSTLIEYIGSSDESWHPKQHDSASSERKSYMHQYLKDTSCASYINQIANLLNLSVYIDNIQKVAYINYSTQKNVTGAYDLTKYVDFGNFRFEPNGESKSITINYTNTDDIAGVPKTINKKFVTSNEGDATDIDTNYEYPAEDEIKVGADGYVTTPIICKDKIYNMEYPNTDLFDMSGSENPRLYFFSGSYVNDFDLSAKIKSVCDATTKANFVDDLYTDKLTTNALRRWQVMTTEKNGIDLKQPSTIIEKLYRTHSNKEQFVCRMYLPSDIYARLKRDSIIFVDGMQFDIVRIDNYNISGDCSCEVTLIKRN